MKNAAKHDKNSSKQASDSADEVALLRDENEKLKQRVAWFEKQLFGQKSEKRKVVDNPQQHSLLGEAVTTEPAKEDK